MRNIKIFVILILICILTILTTITAEKIIAISKLDSKIKKNIESDRIKIGFSMGTLKEERWLKDRDKLKEMIEELGGEVIIKNANNDDDDQIKQVQNLLKENIDVLILVPNDHTRASAAVNMAKDAGVKVISYDRLVLNSDADVYMSFDNKAVGEKMAGAIVNKVKKGRILIVNGDPSDNNTQYIQKGYNNVLKEYVENGDIEIVEEFWAEDWMQESAFVRTNELLLKGETFDGVIAANDSLAGGVIRALAEHRLAGDVFVTGQDSDLDACQRVIEGTQLMTVYKSVDKMAEETAKIAMQLARKEPLHIKDVINDGKFLVPYYNIEVQKVDKWNMESVIIENGFHKKEEIYR